MLQFEIEQCFKVYFHKKWKIWAIMAGLMTNLKHVPVLDFYFEVPKAQKYNLFKFIYNTCLKTQ